MVFNHFTNSVIRQALEEEIEEQDLDYTVQPMHWQYDWFFAIWRAPEGAELAGLTIMSMLTLEAGYIANNQLSPAEQDQQNRLDWLFSPILC